jgi:hypothetical protein
MTLQIGQANAALAALQQIHGVEASTFITAWNPCSQATSDDVNASRQRELAHELKQLGVGFFDGIGQHPSNQWPGEPGFLVLGLSLGDATSLGLRHEQNAIVWCGRDAVPQLILLR